MSKKPNTKKSVSALKDLGGALQRASRLLSSYSIDEALLYDMKSLQRRLDAEISKVERQLRDERNRAEQQLRDERKK
jgi:hypothetical protein